MSQIEHTLHLNKHRLRLVETTPGALPIPDPGEGFIWLEEGTGPTGANRAVFRNEDGMDCYLAEAVAELKDTTIIGPTGNQALTYDSGTNMWINQDIIGVTGVTGPIGPTGPQGPVGPDGNISNICFDYCLS